MPMDVEDVYEKPYIKPAGWDIVEFLQENEDQAFTKDDLAEEFDKSGSYILQLIRPAIEREEVVFAKRGTERWYHTPKDGMVISENGEVIGFDATPDDGPVGHVEAEDETGTPSEDVEVSTGHAPDEAAEPAGRI